MKRVLCVWLPEFPLQTLFNEQPDLKSRPAVLYTRAGSAARVFLSSADARRSGICAGMSLAEAQALLEMAVFLPHDPDASLRELEQLAGWCRRYSPIVGLERSCDMDCLVMDITGCSHLAGGEWELARQIVVELAARGYFTHVAVAGTMGAAWAIARFGHCTGSSRRLRSLPAESLRLPAETVARLHEFELRTVGCLLETARESLPSRFGTQLLTRLDQMFGRCEESLLPVKCSEPISVQWAGDDLIGHPSAVLHFCAERLKELLSRVDACGEGILQLTLILYSGSAESVVIEICLNRPTDSRAHLMGLLKMKLEFQQIPACLTAMVQTASATAVMVTRQHWLFQRDDSDDRSEVSRLLDRLGARLGQEAVVRPEVLPEIVPEQVIAWRTVAERVASAARSVCTPEPDAQPHSRVPERMLMASARPLQLLSEPVPVEAETGSCTFRQTFRSETSQEPFGSADDGTGDAEQFPVQFQWNHCRYRSRCHSGFERIETAWWQDGGKVHRDYCRLETSAGSCFWLFRDSHNRWFLHGVFE